jgi:hypothetical protein
MSSRNAIRILSLLAVIFTMPGAPLAQIAPPRETGVVLVEKTYRGTNLCTNLDDGAPCGTERWLVTVYADGTRTIRTFLDMPNTASQITMVMRVDAEFRPIDAFANVYSTGRFLGSGFYAIEGHKLKQSINTPDGVFVDQIDVPEDFSLLLHPASADGWHYGYYDRNEAGQQASRQCTLGAAGRSVMCAFSERILEFVGTETITVPAGTFETQRFKFGDSTELWLTGPDRIIVQHRYREGGSLYRLTEFEETTSK